MVENQYIVDIGTNADPTPIEELGGAIQTAIDNAENLNNSFNIDTSSIEEAEAALQKLEESDQAYYAADVDEWGFPIVQGAEEAANALDNASESASGLKDELGGIDSSSLQETANNANEASDSIDSASDSISVAGAGAGALAGIGIGAFFMGAANSAGNAKASTEALATNYNLTGAALDNVTNKISELSSATGVSKGEIRNTANMVGKLGVTSTDSALGITKLGAQLSWLTDGTNDYTAQFSQMMGKFVGMDTIPSRALTRIGINMDEMAARSGRTKEEVKELWKSMTPDERANFLTKYGLDAEKAKDANEGLQTSFDTLKDKFGNSLAALATSVGTMVLPILIPAFEAATTAIIGLVDGFKWLNSVTGGAAGWFVGIVGGIFAFASLAPGVKLVFNNFKDGIGIIKGLPGTVSGAFNKINTAINGQGPGVNSLRYKYNNLKLAAQNMGTGIKNTLTSTGTKISGFATTAGGKLKSVGTAFLNAGRQALISAGRFVLAGAQAAASAIKTGILTIATWLQTAAQTALNLVMSINPIYLIVMAIIALIAVLAYLYYNNETVRNAINGLWAGLQQVGQVIYGVLIGAWNALVGALTGAYNAVVGFVTGGIAWISQLPARIQMYLTMVIGRVLAWGSNLINQGRATATKFVGTVVSCFTSLPGKIYNAIKGVADKVKSVFANAGTAAWNAFVAALDSVSGGLASIAINAVQGAVSGGDSGYTAGGDFTTASTGYTSPNLDKSINQSSNNGTNYNFYNTNDFTGIIDQDAAEYIVDVMTRKTKEELLKIGKAI